MTIEEKVRETMLSKELSNAEKRDQFRALIPAHVFKIYNLNKAMSAQLVQLKGALEVAAACNGSTPNC
jgi:hypothetical protein